MSLQLIFGIHAVKEAIEAGTEISKVIVQRELASQALHEIESNCRRRHIPVQRVPREKFNTYKSKNHQGVIAFVSPVLYQSLEQLVPTLFEEAKVPLLLMLDRITDVRNLGAIARSAYAAGVHAIIVPLTESAPINEDAIKTSAGALMHIPVCREAHFKTTLEFLHQSGIKSVACTEKARTNIDAIDFTEPVVVIMGSEEKGISSELLRRCTEMAKIPMEFGVQSLNVSVAAEIILYESTRQRFPRK